MFARLRKLQFFKAVRVEPCTGGYGRFKCQRVKLDLWEPYASIIADQNDKGYVEAGPANEDPLRMMLIISATSLFYVQRAKQHPFALYLQPMQAMCL